MLATIICNYFVFGFGVIVVSHYNFWRYTVSNFFLLPLVVLNMLSPSLKILHVKFSRGFLMQIFQSIPFLILFYFSDCKYITIQMLIRDYFLFKDSPNSLKTSAGEDLSIVYYKVTRKKRWRVLIAIFQTWLYL